MATQLFLHFSSSFTKFGWNFQYSWLEKWLEIILRLILLLEHTTQPSWRWYDFGEWQCLLSSDVFLGASGEPEYWYCLYVDYLRQSPGNRLNGDINSTHFRAASNSFNRPTLKELIQIFPYGWRIFDCPSKYASSSCWLGIRCKKTRTFGRKYVFHCSLQWSGLLIFRLPTPYSLHTKSDWVYLLTLIVDLQIDISVDLILT